MSAILGIRGVQSTRPDAAIHDLLGRMHQRGTELTGIERTSNGLVAVVRDRWEALPQHAGETLVAARGSLRVVCDATLYFVDDLVASLERAGAAPTSRSAADLIAAAYEAFGTECVDYIEGDFAFCIIDDANGDMFCARDPFGTRSLFYSGKADDLAVASTPHPLVDWGGRTPAYDPQAVLRALVMRYGDGTSNAWSGVSELPAAHWMHVRGGAMTVRRYWLPQGSERYRSLSYEDAPLALRELLRDVVRQRLVGGGTSLALSGGQDSTALLASMQAVSDDRPPLVSMRYPEGDPGDEAWYVQAVADWFGLDVQWLDIAAVPLYRDLTARAQIRSHCHGQLFESHNRNLAQAALRSGTRILLNGHGGDNIMAAGPWKMADLLRQGRLLALRRYRKDRGYRGMKGFVDHVLRPALPLFVFDNLERVLGRRLCTRPYEQTPGEWIIGGDLLERMVVADRAHYADVLLSNYRGYAWQQRAWALIEPSHPRGCAASFDLNRSEGVELRMPFYDRRMVEFMMSRPFEELNQPKQYKALLRRAMDRQLPERQWIIQAGGYKPGSAIGILQSEWGAASLELIREMNESPWITAELGVVDAGVLADRTVGRGHLDWWSAVAVSLTIFSEQWLRSNSRPALVAQR
ncbi:MAG: asparagine synthetase B family protein [Longimicrobiales bacterium]